MQSQYMGRLCEKSVFDKYKIIAQGLTTSVRAHVKIAQSFARCVLFLLIHSYSFVTRVACLVELGIKENRFVTITQFWIL